MKIAYFDCFSGISGDMALGALLACAGGAGEAALRGELAGLKVAGYDLLISQATRGGLSASDVEVRLAAPDRSHGRHLSDICKIIERSPLAARVKDRAKAIFTRLADSEAKAHGLDREKIHFHEVGAVDAIVDIVGCCILLEVLSIDKTAVSAFPCGYGAVECAHGTIPLPAPATVALLEGFPVRPVDIEGELVTPTGVAIATALSDPREAGRIPAMRVLASGFGAGKKQFTPGLPNLLRVIVGEAEDAAAIIGERRRACVIETNLDDERAETLGYVLERCLAAGAWDVYFTPITMKKSRPAIMASVLCDPKDADTMAAILFRETGTFGLRIREMERRALDRERRTVETPYGAIRIKIGSWQGEELTAAPEYEDCRQAAEAHRVPLKAVYESALAAYRR